MLVIKGVWWANLLKGGVKRAVMIHDIEGMMSICYPTDASTGVSDTIFIRCHTVRLRQFLQLYTLFQ
jgi:hypothetical protein